MADDATGHAASSGTVAREHPPALARVRTLARVMDRGLRVPGTDFRVGLDPILGVLPAAGDAVAALASLYIVAEACRADVPDRVLARMLGHVAVDLVVGSVPLVGPLFDAVWRANEWNARLFAEHTGE